MAGEKIKIVKGGSVHIRGQAPNGGVAAGDVDIVGSTPGFWMHDVAAGEKGDFCIKAFIVSIPNNGEIHKAGEIFQVAKRGRNDDNLNANEIIIHYDPDAQLLQNKIPYQSAIVYDGAMRRDSRILVTWGLW